MVFALTTDVSDSMDNFFPFIVIMLTKFKRVVTGNFGNWVCQAMNEVNKAMYVIVPKCGCSQFYSHTYKNKE